jgi:LytS/YehU family sensor histidine kinase
LFYLNAHWLLPLAFKTKHALIFAPLLIFVELTVYLIIKYLLDDAIVPHFLVSTTVYIRQILVPNLYRGIYIWGISTLYWAVLRIIRFRKQVYETKTSQLITLKEKAELERNLAEALNAYLQQQINPHLLFNTLTFIHNTYYKFSKEASRCVLLLVDIMRFTLDEVDISGKTLLMKEVEQIENFIELNQLRFDYELFVDFTVIGDLNSQQIIPLILLTLTENIFKHGYLKDKQHAAKINISLSQDNELKFVSWNLKKHEPEKRRIKSIGIKNVIKRLEYSYEHRYKLNIHEEGDSFGLELMMHL